MKSDVSILSPRKDYLQVKLYKDKIRQLPKIYRSLKIPFSPALSARMASPSTSCRNSKRTTSLDKKQDHLSKTQKVPATS